MKLPVLNLFRRFAPAVVLAGLSSLAAADSNGIFLADRLSLPSGIVSIGQDIWVSDDLAGFCRLDPVPPPASGSALNPATCLIGGPLAVGTPHWDPSSGFLYLPDPSSKSLGVWRFTYSPASRTFTSPRLLSGILGPLRPLALTLGPDGHLYVSVKRSPVVYRITTPAGATQSTVAIGQTNDANPANALAFVGADLYLAQMASVSRIPKARTCTAAAPCAAASTNIRAFGPTALLGLTNRLVIADNVAGSGVLYNYVVSTDRQDIWSRAAVAPGSASPVQYPGLIAIGKNDTDILLAADIVESRVLNQTVLYRLPVNAPLLDLGTPKLPGFSPLPPGSLTATFAGDGFTKPRGFLVLGTTPANKSLWISDRSAGFCRIDIVPGSFPSRYAITKSTCKVLASQPGQATYHPASNSVFVPDESTKSTGVWRFKYLPASKTLGAAVRLGASAFASVRATAVALDGGNLYVGAAGSPAIRLIRNAVTATAADTTGDANVSANVPIVANTSNGAGVTGIALSAGTLFLAQSNGLAEVRNIATAGVPVTASTIPASSAVSNITALLTLDNGKIAAAVPSGVYLFNPASPGAAPFLLSTQGSARVLEVIDPLFSVSGLGLDIDRSLLIADDAFLGDFVGFGRAWSLSPLSF